MIWSSYSEKPDTVYNYFTLENRSITKCEYLEINNRVGGIRGFNGDGKKHNAKNATKQNCDNLEIVYLKFWVPDNNTFRAITLIIFM